MKQNIDDFEKKELEMVNKVIELIESRKGENLIVIDVQGATSITNHIFIVTANSTTHANSLGKYCIDFFVDSEYKNFLYQKNVELDNPWILIDATDIIVHIFLAEQREFYSLEKLYSKGKLIYKSGGIK